MCSWGEEGELSGDEPMNKSGYGSQIFFFITNPLPKLCLFHHGANQG